MACFLQDESTICLVSHYNNAVECVSPPLARPVAAFILRCQTDNLKVMYSVVPVDVTNNGSIAALSSLSVVQSVKFANGRYLNLFGGCFLCHPTKTNHNTKKQ